MEFERQYSGSAGWQHSRRGEPRAAHYWQMFHASTYGDDSVAYLRPVRRNVTIGYRLGEFSSDEQVAA